jgi:hypothetical protein
LQLQLAAQIGLELGEHAQHVEEALSRRSAGVDGLLCGFQDRPARPDSTNDVVKIADAPGEAIDAGHHQHVAGVKNCSTVRSASRPSVEVPPRFSARMTWQPAALSAASWIARVSWPLLTR